MEDRGRRSKDSSQPFPRSSSSSLNPLIFPVSPVLPVVKYSDRLSCRRESFGGVEMNRVIPFLLLARRVVRGQAPKSVTVVQTDEGKKAIGRIQQLGGQVMELAQNDQRLEVSYLYADGKIPDEHLTQLKALKGLVHLNLRGQPIT